MNLQTYQIRSIEEQENMDIKKITTYARMILEECEAEPKPKFKVGDWVVAYDSHMFKIKQISTDKYPIYSYNLHPCCGYEEYQIRAATEQEILKKLAKFKTGDSVYCKDSHKRMTVCQIRLCEAKDGEFVVFYKLHTQFGNLQFYEYHQENCIAVSELENYRFEFEDIKEMICGMPLTVDSVVLTNAIKMLLKKNKPK